MENMTLGTSDVFWETALRYQPFSLMILFGGGGETHSEGPPGIHLTNYLLELENNVALLSIRATPYRSLFSKGTNLNRNMYVCERVEISGLTAALFGNLICVESCISPHTCIYYEHNHP